MTKAVILALLRTKYSNLGLNEKTLGELADAILAKEGLTAETLEGEVDAIAPLLKITQKEAQRQVTEALKAKPKTEDENKPAGTDPSNDNPKEPKNDDVPAWAKGLIESNNELKSQLESMKQEKTIGTRKSVFQKELDSLPDSLKNSYLSDFDRLSFKDDADFTTWLESKKTELTTIKADTVVKKATAFGAAEKPGSTESSKQATPQAVDELFNNIISN